jgi:hypothetical protein
VSQQENLSAITTPRTSDASTDPVQNPTSSGALSIVITHCISNYPEENLVPPPSAFLNYRVRADKKRTTESEPAVERCLTLLSEDVLQHCMCSPRPPRTACAIAISSEVVCSEAFSLTSLSLPCNHQAASQRCMQPANFWGSPNAVSHHLHMKGAGSSSNRLRIKENGWQRIQNFTIPQSPNLRPRLKATPQIYVTT